jgi:hypothetical protein
VKITTTLAFHPLDHELTPSDEAVHEPLRAVVRHGLDEFLPCHVLRQKRINFLVQGSMDSFDEGLRAADVSHLLSALHHGRGTFLHLKAVVETLEVHLLEEGLGTSVLLLTKA